MSPFLLTAEPAGKSRNRILLVDDDFSILQTLQEILLLEGFPVRTAQDGREALRAIEHERPDLVVLDMRMPLLDGWGVARELAKRGIDVPVLVMTAAQDGLRWAREIKASGYIGKPFDIDTLLDEIERCLANPHDTLS
jgi:two-component system, chemotaxis family, chemotaxis protein CheY